MVRVAAERRNNAGRVTGKLSEANRALYPTRVHYFVIAHESLCIIFGVIALSRRVEQRPRHRVLGRMYLNFQKSQKTVSRSEIKLVVLFDQANPS